VRQKSWSAKMERGAPCPVNGRFLAGSQAKISSSQSRYRRRGPLGKEGAKKDAIGGRPFTIDGMIKKAGAEQGIRSQGRVGG